jgi:hypothetical protein
VKLSDLQAGLDALQDQPEPTMLVVPDGNLLKATEYATLMTSMIAQCGKLMSRVAVLDVQSGLEPDPKLWLNQIGDFRTAVGMNSLGYGIAYYPYLKTTITSGDDVDYDNCGGAAALTKLLPEYATDPATKAILDAIQKPPAVNAPSPTQSDQALLIACPSYALIQDAVLGRINTLPPSGAIAGVYSLVDNAEGVWKAPANVSLSGVTDTTLRITDFSQQPLNVDAATGKSINAIRLFPGLGVLVWGARTLDGNSGDNRYVNVRRTLIMLEQSIRLAARSYVFEANDANTWSTVNASLSAFLAGLWSEGALAGPTAASAFEVQVGLGTTMTGQDILDGRMNISVKVALTHPAEFIVITYSQMMQKAA